MKTYYTIARSPLEAGGTGPHSVSSYRLKGDAVAALRYDHHKGASIYRVRLGKTTLEVNLCKKVTP